MAKNQVTLTFAGDTKSLDAAFNKLQGESGKTQSKLGKLGTAAKVASGLFLGGLVFAAKAGFDELRQGQAVTAQTNAVLKSTGGIANVTASQVDKLSSSLMNKSGVDDEVIKSGANMILTFTNIRNEVGKGNNIFDQATTTALDMSVAMGTDLKGSAVLVGKALNDPIKGLSALSRVGVTFTDGQKQAIKAMVASGNTMGAQKVILQELQKEFGGSAQAAGSTLSGQLNRAQQTFNNLAGSIVGAVLPAFTSFAGVLNTVLGWLSQHQTTTKVLIGILGGLAVGVWAVNTATKVWAATQTVLNVVLSANPIGAVILAIAGLAAGIVIAYKNSETFRNIVKGAFDTVKTVVVGVYDWFKNNWPLLLGILTGPFGLAVTVIVKKWGAIQDGATETKNWIRDRFNDIVSFVTGMPGRISAAATGMFDGIKNAFRSAINWIIGKWNGLSFSIPGVDTHIPGVGKIGGFSLSTPDIGYLAQGGLINKPTLAMVGEAGPEAVIPLSRPRRAAQLMAEAGLSGSGGPAIHIDTMVVQDATDIDRVASRLGRQLMMRTA